MKSPRYMTFVLLCLIGSAGCGKRKTSGVDGEFESARGLLVRGQYEQADGALRAYLKKNPKSRYASRVGLLLFKTAVATEDYAAAKQWCDWTIEQFPKSLEAHKCRYKLAFLAMIQGNPESASNQFEQLASSPDGPLAAEALAMQRFLKKNDE